jgi:tetratricopeptide (TPR) repeat protein
VGKKKSKSIQVEAKMQTASAPMLWLWSLALLVTTLIAYQPAWNGRPIWDDDAHMTRPELRSLSGLAQIWTKPGATQQYYPFVHSVFWLEQKLWGDAVAPYHLVNILLHVASALLLLRTLLHLQVPGAWLAAAIFALHPLQAESVAWISELKNTLSGAFFLSSALLYLRFNATRNLGAYISALILFLLGLMSKSVIATLPAVLLVVLWWKNGKLSWKKDVSPLIPFFAAGICAGLVTAWVERSFIGAQGEAFDLSIIERCLIAGRAFWFYLFKLAWPAKLTFIYPRWQVDETIWWQYAFPIAAILLLAVLWKLQRKWRAPLAGTLLFAGMLFPALGFVNVYPFVYSFVADHFQYLACIGMIVLAASGIALLLDRAKLGQRPIGHSICLALPGLLAVLTWRQSHIYTDAQTLWFDTLEKNPDCYMAHNNLSVDLLEQGKVDEAIAHSQRAVALRPDDAQSNVSLANALRRKGDVDESIAYYQKALQIAPKYAKAHTNLGNALRQKRQFREAIAEYEKAYELDPAAFAPQNNLAWMLATCPDTSLRNGNRALTLVRRADQLSGGRNPIVRHTLAAAYAQSGLFAKAVETAQQALSLATAQGNPGLAQTLQREIQQYQARLSPEQ